LFAVLVPLLLAALPLPPAGSWRRREEYRSWVCEEDDPFGLREDVYQREWDC